MIKCNFIQGSTASLTAYTWFSEVFPITMHCVTWVSLSLSLPPSPCLPPLPTQRHILQSIIFMYFSSIISKLQWYFLPCVLSIIIKITKDKLDSFRLPLVRQTVTTMKFVPRKNYDTINTRAVFSKYNIHADIQIKQTFKCKIKYALLWKYSKRDYVWKRHYLKN